MQLGSPADTQRTGGAWWGRKGARVDLSLSDDQIAIQASFAQFFSKECPTERVRAAEPLGFDAGLWRQIGEIGAVGMSVAAETGGGGGGMVELALVAEQFGALPFIFAGQLNITNNAHIFLFESWQVVLQTDDLCSGDGIYASGLRE